MPATRYVSKQLADWSVLDQSETADRGARETITIMRGGNPQRSASARSNRDIPFVLFTKRSRSRILTASLLWHKQHTMPEPAFAFLFFFYFFHSFITPLPCTVAVLESENLLLPPLYIVHLSESRDTRAEYSSFAPFLYFSRTRAITLSLSHNSLLPTRAIPLPISLYGQLCYISKI